MKSALCLIITLLLFPSASFADPRYTEVTAQGNRQVYLAIAPVKNLGGTPNETIAREIGDILKFDLNLAGPFSILTGSANEASSGIRPGEFDFAPWRSIGAAFLIKSGYAITGNSITLEFRMYDVLNGKSLDSKRYTGILKDLRKMTHTFSDETLFVITGEKGPFTGKITYVSPLSGNKEIYHTH
ncbi:MAG: hypothetical protein WCG31_05895 [Deltaproteobacteria bacterium]